MFFPLLVHHTNHPHLHNVIEAIYVITQGIYVIDSNIELISKLIYKGTGNLCRDFSNPFYTLYLLSLMY